VNTTGTSSADAPTKKERIDDESINDFAGGEAKIRKFLRHFFEETGTYPAPESSYIMMLFGIRFQLRMNFL
jgi:hypothetical protein